MPMESTCPLATQTGTSHQSFSCLVSSPWLSGPVGRARLVQQGPGREKRHGSALDASGNGIFQIRTHAEDIDGKRSYLLVAHHLRRYAGHLRSRNAATEKAYQGIEIIGSLEKRHFERRSAAAFARGSMTSRAMRFEQCEPSRLRLDRRGKRQQRECEQRGRTHPAPCGNVYIVTCRKERN